MASSHVEEELPLYPIVRFEATAAAEVRQNETSFSLHIGVDVVSTTDLAMTETERGQAKLKWREGLLTGLPKAWRAVLKYVINGPARNRRQVLVQSDPLIMPPD